MTGAGASLRRLSPEIDRAKDAHGAALVVGVGGLGCAAAIELERRGVRRLQLVDGDRVELSNLHRQLLFAADDIGQPKAAVAARKLSAARPSLDVSARVTRLGEADVHESVEAHDVVVDATDDAATKFLLNDVCVELGRPLVHAGASGFQGQVLTILPGRSACLRCLFPDAPGPDEAATCRDGGVLGPLPSWIGSLQAEHAMLVLRDRPRAGRLITVDARSLRIREIEVTRSPACPSCSNAAMIGARTAARRAMPERIVKEMS